jgi:hypothetical protein
MKIIKIEFWNGVRYGYYQGDKFIKHRDDGPAVAYISGHKTWYIHGKIHREDGPAVEFSSGTKEWYADDFFHREDGPAVEFSNGDKEWYLEGKKIKEKDFEEAVRNMQIKKRELKDHVEYGYYQGYKFTVHREDGPAIEYANGNKQWFIHGKRHRKDGPTIEWASGSKEWWFHGKLHRENGPAIEGANGDKYWYLNGKLHREDGPAKEYADGYKFWYLDGKEIKEKDFEEAVRIYKFSKICK